MQPRLFSIGLLSSLLAAGAHAQVVTYDFNGLNGNLFPAPPTPLAGQDGWVDHSIGTQIGVRASGVNGTPCLYFDSLTASHQGRATRIDDALFDTPDLSGNERFYIEAVVAPSPFATSDGQISLGRDDDGDSLIGASERGATLFFGVNGIGVRDALGNVVTVPVANAGGAAVYHTLRLRLVVDPVESRCTLYAQNLTSGGLNLKTVTGMVGVPFATDMGQSDARNPSRWNGVDVGTTGRGVWIDNLAFGKFPRSSVVESFDGLMGASTPPYVPLAGQGSWISGFGGSIPGVVSGGGFDGSNCVELLGSGLASRQFDTQFGVPPLLGSETELTLSVRIRLATSGSATTHVTFGYDEDGDGLINAFSASESAFTIAVIQNSGVGNFAGVRNAALTQITTSLGPVGPSGGDWIEFRLVMDVSSNRYNLYGRNLTTNGTLQALINSQDAGFSESFDRSNPRLWDGIALLGDQPGPRYDSLHISIGGATNPVTYCAAQVNSAGCTPAIGWSGSTSLSDAQPLVISATQMLANKSFVLFYSASGANDAPFLGGTLCVKSPLKRTPVGMTTSSGAACGATASFGFEAYLAAGGDPLLQVGSSVWAQFWSRDPASASFTNLTNGIAFDLAP